jgi:taurine dioxygenase
MSFTVEPLSPDLTFGKTIRGLTSRHIRDPDVCELLRRHWIEDGLVVFRDGEINEDFHLALSRIFGPLEAHPVRELLTEGKPELITLRSVPEDTTILDVDGEVGGGYLGWHKDLVYVEQINHGGILRALKASRIGGRTSFIDQIDAYNRLPDDLKQQAEGLHVVYRLGSFDEMKYMTRAKFRVLQTAASAQSVIDSVQKHFPPVSHPLIFVQPETGRKVLNLSPFFAMYIEELGPEGGHELLTRLAHHVLDSPAYHHAWTTDEMILWDNWRMLHSVSPAPVTEERVMQRTTIKGDYGAGRKLPFPEAA